MATPKHKIFFGAPGGPNGSTAKSVTDLNAGKVPFKEPKWSWDTTKAVFSSALLKFDTDFDLATLTGEAYSDD